MNLSRRATVLATAVGLGVAATVAFEVSYLFGTHYPPTPYDDLLALLADRDAAKTVGRTFLSQHPGFSPKTAAQALRGHLRKRDLPSLLTEEIGHGELSVAGGWIMPATLLGLCALAAGTQT
jgi:hypothetical protein